MAVTVLKTDSLYDHAIAKEKSQLEQDLIVDSPHCLSYNFYDVSLEIFILDQLIIPLIHIFLFLITCLLDNVLIL